MKKLILSIIGMLLFAGCASHSVRQTGETNMQHFFRRLENGETLTVAYLGGSITWGATATDPLKTSWRALLTEQLRREYPAAHIVPVDAAIGGKGSDLGVFRMDRDVLPHRPDLTFVEFAVNDAQNPERLECMEGILRKLHNSNPDMAIVLVITGYGRQGKFDSPREEDHRRLAAFYGIPAVSVVPEVRRLIAENAITTEAILTDGTHPNDAGYALYADIIRRGLRDAATSAPSTPWPVNPLTENRFESARMLELSRLPGAEEGWKTELPSVTGAWFDHQPSRWLNSVVVPATPSASLSVDSDVSGAGVYFEMIPGGDRFELLADGKPLFSATTAFPREYPGMGNQFRFIEHPGRQTVTLKAGGRKLRLGYLLLTGP